MPGESKRCLRPRWTFTADQKSDVIAEWEKEAWRAGRSGLERRVQWVDPTTLNRIKRGKKSLRYVRRISETMARCEPVPPAVGMKMFPDSPIFVSDGNHRIEAAIAAGLRRIPILMYRQK